MVPVLTIAGSDSGGGAGLQQDLKVFTVLQAYGASVVTALTAQNTLGVHGVWPVEPDFVARQLEAVLSDIRPVAIKTGMLANAQIVQTVAQALKNYEGWIVVDPVMVSKNGHPLLAEDAVEALATELLPLADIVTPNIPEAEALLGYAIASREDMERAATELACQLKTSSWVRPGHAPAVLLKGGHIDGGGVCDILADDLGLHAYEGARLATPHTHGTGCTLSAALAVYLGQGLEPVEAAARAKEMVTKAIRAAFPVGQGIGPTNPMAVIGSDLARYPVLMALEAAWERLSAFPCRRLVPEIQMNLGYALPWATAAKDVAAFPGRLVGLRDGIARVHGPEFGASSHVARIILTAMSHDPECRAAVNIRYEPAFLESAGALGLRVAEFSRTEEPEDVKRREGSSLVWGVDWAIRNVGEVPDLIYDEGDVGKEPVIRVLGKNPLEVVNKALQIAGLLEEPA